MRLLKMEYLGRKRRLERPRGVPGSIAGAGEYKPKCGKKTQINSTPWGLGLYFLTLDWVLGRTGKSLVLGYMASVLCLAAGFWRTKFDPSLTQRDTFHLDEQFTVPVDMMQAHTYPLRWFLLEQPEIQVSLCGPTGWAWVLGGREGRRQAVEQPQG